MQLGSESRLVLHHVARVELFNKLHSYHHHWPLWKHEWRGIEHLRVHDLDHLKTPEPLYRSGAKY
jgi:hypothetical protein